MCSLKMMDEMSVTMGYDAHSMEQMSEEEILACLVAETGPTFTVRNHHWARASITGNPSLFWFLFLCEGTECRNTVTVQRFYISRSATPLSCQQA